MFRKALLAGLSGGLLAITALLVYELKRVPAPVDASPELAETSPLTDVAGEPRHAWYRAALPGRGGGVESDTDPSAADDPAAQRVAPPPPYVLPADLPDPSNPAQGTASLVVPGVPRPPDPFAEPEMAQNPERGRSRAR
jgi:hypothetical protein